MPQQQKFHADDTKFVWNQNRSSDWSCEKRTQWYTRGKKIWLSMQLKNFGSDKIVQTTYVHPPLHVGRCKMTSWGLKMVLDIHVTDNN